MTFTNKRDTRESFNLPSEIVMSRVDYNLLSAYRLVLTRATLPLKVTFRKKMKFLLFNFLKIQKHGSHGMATLSYTVQHTHH